MGRKAPDSQCSRKITGAASRTAVLILNYNGSMFLDDCFQSLLRNSQPASAIYLIDNDSSDDSVAFTRSRYPMVRVIENKENLGFARAYDRVIRELDYDFFVLLNNDTRVDEDWLQKLLAVIVADGRIAACGSKIFAAADGTIDHAGGMLTLIGAGLDLGKHTMDNGRYDTGGEIGFVCGCSLLIRKSAYIDIGGFDPDYFMYHEDVDLCWRFRLAGYPVMYVPESIVYHYGGGGGSADAFKTYQCQKNRLANIVKNREPGGLFLSLAVSTVFDVLRVIRFVAAKRVDLMRAIMRGYCETGKDIGNLLRKRRTVQSTRVCSDAELKPAFASLASSIRNYSRVSKK